MDAKQPPARRAALNMYSPLSAILWREPVTVPLEASLLEALQLMDRMRLGAIVVADPRTRVPLGIFTLQDLLRRVALTGADTHQPIAYVMTSGLVTLRPEATAHQAALAMARHRVRHVVVVDAEGRLVGLVSQTDLFGLQRVGVKDISLDIQRATDLPALVQAARDIRGLADRQMAQGIHAETLTHFMSTLNDLLTVRVIELTVDEHELPAVPLCWMALGSEGRLEQTFSTDQDNGLIFDAGPGDADEVRRALLPFARSVNQKLAACGFPLCEGDIMAGNPRWCLTLDEWRQRFSDWIFSPEPEALLNATIFFDLRPVYGQEALAERLRDWLLAEAPTQPRFLHLMADNALRCRPPLGTLRDFVFDDSKEFPRTLDLKKFGSRPFVEAARIFSLAHQVRPTSTAERLRALGERGQVPPEDLAGIVDGFYFIHLLRLRNQVRLPHGHAGANRVDPRSLNDLDRHIMKESFRQARKLQNHLALHWRLSVT